MKFSAPFIEVIRLFRTLHLELHSSLAITPPPPHEIYFESEFELIPSINDPWPIPLEQSEPTALLEDHPISFHPVERFLIEGPISPNQIITFHHEAQLLQWLSFIWNLEVQSYQELLEGHQQKAVLTQLEEKKQEMEKKLKRLFGISHLRAVSS